MCVNIVGDFQMRVRQSSVAFVANVSAPDKPQVRALASVRSPMRQQTHRIKVTDMHTRPCSQLLVYADGVDIGIMLALAVIELCNFDQESTNRLGSARNLKTSRHQSA